MIAPNQALEASSEVSITIILTQLDQLIDPAIAIAQVGGLRVANMNTEAFSRAKIRGSVELIVMLISERDVYKPMARA